MILEVRLKQVPVINTDDQNIAGDFMASGKLGIVEGRTYPQGQPAHSLMVFNFHTLANGWKH